MAFDEGRLEPLGERAERTSERVPVLAQLFDAGRHPLDRVSACGVCPQRLQLLGQRAQPLSQCLLIVARQMRGVVNSVDEAADELADVGSVAVGLTDGIHALGDLGQAGRHRVEPCRRRDRSIAHDVA